MKKLTLFGLFFIYSLQIIGQNYSFEDLVNFKLLDAGPITSKNEVQGYYLFFEKDKIEKDSTEFIVKILDQNLNELTNKEIKAGANTNIEALVFNGKSIFLKQFKSQDKKKVDFTMMNMRVNGDLSVVGEKTIKTGKHSKSLVYPVSGKGFANIFVDHKRKAILEFYDDKGLSWTYKTPENVKWEELDYVAQYENKIIFSVFRANRLTESGGDYFIKAFDYKSGEMLYEQAMTDFGFDHEISKGFVNPLQEEIWLTGDYYRRNLKEVPENSEGLFIMKMSPDGEILDTDYAPWNGKINRYSKSYKKGKLKDGFIHMHDFVFLKGGEVFGVGEQYRKAFRAWGLAEAAVTLGSYGRLAKVHIGDLLVFKFGTNAKLVETKRNRKPDKQELPNKGFYGGLLMSGKKMGRIMEDLHAFDFAHVSVDDDHESFTVFYFMKEQMSKKVQKKYKRKPRYILKTLTFKDKEWTKDKFYLSDGKGETALNVLPAKPGYVLVYEISKDYTGLRLEKIK